MGQSWVENLTWLNREIVGCVRARRRGIDYRAGRSRHNGAIRSGVNDRASRRGMKAELKGDLGRRGCN